MRKYEPCIYLILELLIFFQEISEKYPSMKVSTFVNSKKKFLQADVNGDGVSKNIKEAWSKGVTL